GIERDQAKMVINIIGEKGTLTVSGLLLLCFDFRENKPNQVELYVSSVNIVYTYFVTLLYGIERDQAKMVINIIGEKGTLTVSGLLLLCFDFRENKPNQVELYVSSVNIVYTYFVTLLCV
ncbi:uncharacterized protein DC041_0002946, partial [Schistosoma bovis]